MKADHLSILANLLYTYQIVIHKVFIGQYILIYAFVSNLHPYGSAVYIYQSKHFLNILTFLLPTFTTFTLFIHFIYILI